MNECARALWRV